MTLLLPGDRPYEEPEILQRIRHGERVDHFESLRIPKDGRAIDVSLTISPIRDRNSGASHVARDITSTKRFQEQLRHTQRLESLGVLAGGVAHDFNNLLTGILGNAAWLTNRCRPRTPTAPCWLISSRPPNELLTSPTSCSPTPVRDASLRP
jgi:nitrogen-specific signal transduction histidine kinase